MVNFPVNPGFDTRVTDGGRVWAWDLEKWTFPELLEGGDGPDPGTDWPEMVEGQIRSYYVAANGSDTNSGTRDQPWASVTRVNTHFQAGGAAQPGDAVMFRAGDTFSGIGLRLFTSGTAANPIFVRSYGPRTSRATIRPGTGALPGSNMPHSPRDCGVYLRNASYNRVSDLIVIGSGSGDGINYGVLFELTSANLARYPGNRIRNLDVSLCGRRGIGIGTTAAGAAASVNPGFDDLIVENCQIYNCNDGLQTWGQWNMNNRYLPHRNVTVRNCIFRNNDGASAQPPDYGWEATWSGNGLVIMGVDGGLVENCVAYENGQFTGGGLGIWAWDTNNVVFRFCESYRNRAAGTDGGGFDIDGGCTNVVFEYCYSHDNRGTGFQVWIYEYAPYTADNIFRFCVSQNDFTGATSLGYASVTLGKGDARPSGRHTVHNCVIYQNRNVEFIRQGIPGYGNPIQTDFFNNIFILAGSASRFVWNGSSSLMRFNGNNYVGNGSFNWNSANYSTLAAWRAAAGSPETLAGADTSRTWAHGLINAGNGGTLTPVGQTPTPAMFAGWLAYQLTAGSQNRGAGLNIQQQFSVNPGPQDMFGNPIQAAALSIGAHSPPS